MSDSVPTPAVLRHSDSVTRRKMYSVKAQCALDRGVSVRALLCVCVLNTAVARVHLSEAKFLLKKLTRGNHFKKRASDDPNHFKCV